MKSINFLPCVVHCMIVLGGVNLSPGNNALIVVGPSTWARRGMRNKYLNDGKLLSTSASYLKIIAQFGKETIYFGLVEIGRAHV